MKRHTIGITILILILNLTLVGFAEARSFTPNMREGRWEFSLQTRYTSSKDFSGEGGSSVSISDDLGWGFGFGYNVREQLNLGLLFTWRSMNYSATIVDGTDPQNTATYGNWLDTSTFGLNAEWTFLRSRVSPYASGAIGWTSIDTNIDDGGSQYGCWYDPWWGYVCSGYESTYGTNSFDWSLGAGLRMELTPEVFLRVGYEHVWLDLDSFDGSDMFRVDLGLLH